MQLENYYKTLCEDFEQNLKIIEDLQQQQKSMDYIKNNLGN